MSRRGWNSLRAALKLCCCVGAAGIAQTAWEARDYRTSRLVTTDATHVAALSPAFRDWQHHHFYCEANDDGALPSHRRYNVGLYEISFDLPANSDRESVMKKLSVAGGLSVVNSFTFRAEMVIAALVCCGSLSAAWRCLTSTSAASCRDILNKKFSTAENGRLDESFGAWDLKGDNEECQLLFAPLLPPDVNRPLTKATTDDTQGFEGMAVACSLEDEESEAKRATLRLVHVMVPFDMFEEGSVTEQRVVAVHNIFCRVIVAQAKRSLVERLLV